METQSLSDSVQIRIVSTIDELVTCQVIRSAAFLGRGEPYEEEFDGNDLISATHLLATRGRQPIGTMRIRIITTSPIGIAAWERLAILPNARGSSKVLTGLAEMAKAYTAFKGIQTVEGAVEDDRLLRFWKRYGFVETGDKPLVYNGLEYRRIRLTLPTDRPNPLDLETASEAEARLFDHHRASGRLAA